MRTNVKLYGKKEKERRRIAEKHHKSILNNESYCGMAELFRCHDGSALSRRCG